MDEKIDKPNKPNKSFVSYGVGLVGFLIGYYGGIAVFLIFLASVLIGLQFAKWYTRKEKISLRLINFIIWSNLITWLIPPLGILTGTIAIQFSNDLESKCNTKKHRILGVIGILISLANGSLGIYTQTHS